MKTITFYSYKGGVGRSLALVNIATRLAEFGKKICVIDFDLEAPGLHLKFPVHPARLAKPYKGIVDYVHKFFTTGIMDKDIKSYILNIPVNNNRQNISLFPAGNTDSPLYWQKLSKINWYQLIYENPNGLAFFLNLKNIIEDEIKPDFLLIDSRTGISEMSGVSLSLFADQIVVLAANNKENLMGAKRIISSLLDKDNAIFDKIPKITFVLSRIPYTDEPRDKMRETQLIQRIKRAYLPSEVQEVNVIHSDRDLEELEQVKIAYEKDETNTQIAIDYLKLFEVITKDDLTEEETDKFSNVKNSEKLVQQANATDNTLLQIELFTKAIQLNDTNAEFFLLRANSYKEMRLFDGSLADIDKALEINKLFRRAAYMKVEILILLNQLDDALKTANKFSKMYKHDVNLMIQIVVIYTKKKNYTNAEQICYNIVNLLPEYSTGYSCRGNVRRLMKKFDSALADIFIALEIDSDNTQAIATLAEIYAETGKINEFYLNIENALKSDPEYIIETIKEEEIYKRFQDEPRFINLLEKYNVFL